MNHQIGNLTTREWLTGLMLQQLISDFNFNVTIEDKLEDNIDDLIDQSIKIADKTCAALTRQFPIWNLPSARQLQWASPSDLLQSEWFEIDQHGCRPVPRCVCLLQESNKSVSVGYFDSQLSRWHRIHTIGRQPDAISPPSSWLPVFFFPSPTDNAANET